MKKILTFILLFLMPFAIFSCNKNNTNSEKITINSEFSSLAIIKSNDKRQTVLVEKTNRNNVEFEEPLQKIVLEKIFKTGDENDKIIISKDKFKNYEKNNDFFKFDFTLESEYTLTPYYYLDENTESALIFSDEIFNEISYQTSVYNKYLNKELIINYKKHKVYDMKNCHSFALSITLFRHQVLKYQKFFINGIEINDINSNNNELGINFHISLKESGNLYENDKIKIEIKIENIKPNVAYKITAGN